MTFHAVKRSMRMSEGRRSLGAMFFLMRDCWRETAEPALLLPLEMEVARERETPSFMAVSSSWMVVVEKKGEFEAWNGTVSRYIHDRTHPYTRRPRRINGSADPPSINVIAPKTGNTTRAQIGQATCRIWQLWKDNRGELRRLAVHNSTQVGIDAKKYAAGQQIPAYTTHIPDASGGTNSDRTYSLRSTTLGEDDCGIRAVTGIDINSSPLRKPGRLLNVQFLKRSRLL